MLHLAEANYGAIFNNSDLFLTAFCKASIRDNPDTCSNLKITEIGNQIIMKAEKKGSGFVKAFPAAVEQLSPFFAKGYASHEHFAIGFIANHDDGYFRKPKKKSIAEMELKVYFFRAAFLT